MKITLTTLLHKRGAERLVTAHTDEDAARDTVYERIAPRWDDIIRCPDHEQCPIDWCTDTHRPLATLTRDQAIDVYRAHRRHTDNVQFTTHEVEVGIDAEVVAAGLGSVFGTEETAVAAIADLDDTTRDRLTAALALVTARRHAAQAVTGIRDILDLEAEGRDVIGVQFTTWEHKPGAREVHPEGTVLYADGVTEQLEFGDEVVEALHHLHGHEIDGQSYTVLVDLRDNSTTGADATRRTIYDLFDVPDLTMPPGEALRRLCDQLTAVENGDADPAEVAAEFATAFRALNTAMSVGATPPLEWERHRTL